MDATTTPTPIAAGGAADAAVEALLKVMVPMARVAIDHGIQFKSMEELLKKAMILAAQDATASSGGNGGSTSQLSVITGLHRQEIKRLQEQTRPASARTEQTRVCELFIRWTTDPKWLDEQGRPLILPRRLERDDQPCFEKLARSVTKDVHPRTMLDELIRLDLASVDPSENSVSLLRGAFVPVGKVSESLAFLGANVGDHLSAAQANVASILTRGPGANFAPPFLEQSIFADELDAESALAGARSASTAWRETAKALAPRLQQLEDEVRTEKRNATHRIRIGMYCFTARLDDAHEGEPTPHATAER
jgi:hypothetical protein